VSTVRKVGTRTQQIASRDTVQQVQTTDPNHAGSSATASSFPSGQCSYRSVSSKPGCKCVFLRAYMTVVPRFYSQSCFFRRIQSSKSNSS